MSRTHDANVHTFCWHDLAASDLASARRFYEQAFGWTFDIRQANGGQFVGCRIGDADVASMYRLRRALIEQGVPSHWTPYLRVSDIDGLVQRLPSLGGRVLVAPFDVDHTARIALIEDAVGAQLGLWQPPAPARMGTMRP